MDTTPAQERALDATVELIGRWGLTKTTLADVARAAGMGRATIYRAFPGGRDELVARLGQRETTQFLAVVTRAIDDAPDVTDALADGLYVATLHLRAHAAACFVLDHEPEVAVPILGFAQLDRLLLDARAALAPHLAGHLPTGELERAEWAAEWATRMFLSGLVNPTAELDLSDRDVCHRLVARYLTPALAPDPTPISLP